MEGEGEEETLRDTDGPTARFVFTVGYPTLTYVRLPTLFHSGLVSLNPLHTRSSGSNLESIT